MPYLYVEKRSVLPPSYVNFIDANNGWEGDLGEKLGHVVLRNKDTIQERWDGYEMTSYLGDCWFPFGSNGGDEMLRFNLDSGGDGIFWMAYIGMSDQEAILQAYPFKDIAYTISDVR
ncbi:MAG: SMI1/KNR4 family protein [Isosphaeraceae bacterium]